MGLGVRGLSDLMPKSDASQRSAQYMQMAQNQKYIPQGGSEKSAGGAIMSGMSGAMAGAELGTMLSASAAAGPYGAAAGGALALGSYLFG